MPEQGTDGARPLKALRLARGWSLREMAAVSGVSVDTLHCLENGRRRPRPRTMRRVADALATGIEGVSEFAREVLAAGGGA